MDVAKLAGGGSLPYDAFKAVAALVGAIIFIVLLGRFTNLGSCREGYKNVAGTCWQTCEGGNAGAICREKCREGYKDEASRCYEVCRYKSSGLGICRDPCLPGYTERTAGLCWRDGTARTYSNSRPRKSYTPKSMIRKSYINPLGAIAGIVFTIVALMIGWVILKGVIASQTGMPM